VGQDIPIPRLIIFQFIRLCVPQISAYIIHTFTL